MAKFVVIKGKQKGAVYQIDATVSIGRSSQENQIVLNDKNVSRIHATISKKTNQYVIKDCGSSNGTIINGKRIREKILKQNDKIQLGECVIVFEPNFTLKGTPQQDGGFVYLEDDSDSKIIPIKKDEKTEKIDVSEETLTRNRLQIMYSVAKIAANATDEKNLLETVLLTLLEGFNAQRGAVILYDDKTNNIYPATIKNVDGESVELTLSKTILNKVIYEKISVLCEDTSKDPVLSSSKSVRLDEVKSVLCVPLFHLESVIGAIYIDTKDILKNFTEDDVELLESAANQIAVAIEKVRSFARTHQELSQLRRKIQEENKVIGESKPLRDVLQVIEKVAKTDSTVLLIGETGVGKELMANKIHYDSNRRYGPFVIVDCTAIPENLLESELFGHEKGAFTGATTSKLGRFELANHGTIFLDEISNLNMTTQLKLLRFLENRTITKVGGVRLIELDVRIVAATNKDLQEDVNSGKFREDLFYRLSVIPIHIPPLRERKSDIPLLCRYFIQKICKRLGKKEMEFSEEALKLLQEFAWPGNIRELRNVIERIVVLSDKHIIEAKDIPLTQEKIRFSNTAFEKLEHGEPLDNVIAGVEKMCITKALSEAHGKKSLAAKILGISRPTLDKKLKELGLEN